MKAAMFLPALVALAAFGQTPEALPRIRDAAMQNTWAYEHLREMTDKVGPRLSGSPGYAAAAKQLAAELKALGAEVTLQPVKVPHWVRGAEAAELVDYTGRPEGLTQPLHLTALGGSGATPAAGITARVVVVHDLDELKARAAEVKGAIVLITQTFDERLAQNGRPGNAYGDGAKIRFAGPGEAAALGALATLTRSIGGANYRLPHTGATGFKDKTPIPAAALSAEDADLITRLAAQGPVKLHLTLTPKTLPDVDSFNVIADWRGTEKPDEFVVVSGHLDSWDLGTGALDDADGVYASAGVIQTLAQLNLHAKRTIRVIAWANEENGLRGAKQYLENASKTLEQHTAVIETDEGGGRSLGISAAVTLESYSQLQPLASVLRPIGANVIERTDRNCGADISVLQNAGVPGFGPLLDARTYFDYHHTAADTFDKVDPENLRSQIATLAVLSYFLAELPQPLPRFKTQ
jgi:carboxypeptidase Q